MTREVLEEEYENYGELCLISGFRLHLPRVTRKYLQHNRVLSADRNIRPDTTGKRVIQNDLLNGTSGSTMHQN